MKTVYVLGNPLLKNDNKPLLILKNFAKRFPDIKFTRFDPTEDIKQDIREYIFLDTVEGINRTAVFDDIRNFSLSPRNSVHDYDLPVDLVLLKKLGRVKKIKIIGIPGNGKIEDILMDLENIFRDI